MKTLNKVPETGWLFLHSFIRWPYIFEFSLLPSSSSVLDPSFPPRRGIIGPGLRSRPNPRYYIDREDLWSAMDDIFKRQQVCIMQGLGGSGKTFAATKYAFRRVEAGDSVVWLKADSMEDVRVEYCRYVAWVLGLDSKDSLQVLDLEALINKANGSGILRNASLIVLDNVERYDDVLPIINGHQSTQFLITTRYPMKAGSEQQPSLHVELPTIESAIQYLRDAGEGKRILTDEDARRIVDMCNCLPLRLSTAVAYLGEHFHVTVDEYLQQVAKIKQGLQSSIQNKRRDLLYPEVSLSIESLQKLSVEGYTMLMCCAYLDPDYIAIKILHEFSRSSEESTPSIFGIT